MLLTKHYSCISGTEGKFLPFPHAFLLPDFHVFKRTNEFGCLGSTQFQ